MTLDMEVLKIKRFGAHEGAHCVVCGKTFDMVGLEITPMIQLILCSAHALNVTRELNDRYYPVWGLRLAHDEGPDDRVLVRIKVAGMFSWEIDRQVDPDTRLYQAINLVSEIEKPGYYALVVAKDEEWTR